MTMIKIFLEAVFKTVKYSFIKDNVTMTIGVIISSIGTFFTMLLGGVDYALIMLVGFVVLDYITGFINSVKNQEVSSDSMYWGIIRKVSQFIVIGIAVAIDRLMGTEFLVLRLMAIYFYIGMEGISLLENLVGMGVPVPGKLISVLEQIKKEEVSNKQIRDESNEKLAEFSIKKRKYKKS